MYGKVIRSEMRKAIIIGAMKTDTGPRATKRTPLGKRYDFAERKICVAKVGVPITRSARDTTKKRITGRRIVPRNFSNS